MNYPVSSTAHGRSYALILRVGILLVLVSAITLLAFKIFSRPNLDESFMASAAIIATPEAKPKAPAPPPSNEQFDLKMAHIVNGDSSGLWPVKAEYPLDGALLPYKRIISFYGNLYSKQMGILGELPPDQMLAKLQGEVKAWQEADTSLEAVPALHYIAVTAQLAPGKGNKHRLRMPFHQIDSVINMARRINGITFIDIQVGLSTLQEEIPQLEPYLKMPDVHLGIDPEFSMKGGQAPGKVVGTFDAADINYASEYLAKLVKENNLPPKVLIVHRFTKGMVTNANQIKTRPEIQVVMDMDGWGPPSLKLNTYRQFIQKEPVEFTGFKLFYKNDVKNNSRMLTRQELLALKPQPVYIQYQ